MVERGKVAVLASPVFALFSTTKLGSEARGARVKSIRTTAGSWPCSRLPRGGGNYLRRGFCSFLVLLALLELLVEETWYVTLTQEIGKRIAGIYGVDHKNCCWQRIFGNLHVLNLIAVGIKEAIAEDY
jgi:hypothetical protein